ncbi:TAXI family TRAP transporter solute-binding subunit [Rhizohabitans arisaemae]|uniref:TAXI family TRAP transporter solute-binding subunit n=1 Tax=Rhizohabitans arisaemae TaxID=2720610 RepID=UPI0024B17481|nr:TAXI family TRAP transporter solute-binding subunit [Rhizohabitans arisaemae]
MRALLAIMLWGTMAVAGCGDTQEPPAPHGVIRIATGPDGGVYQVYGREYARVIHDRLPEVAADSFTTAGTVENIELVTSGRAQVGFALADVAADAVAGRPPFRVRQPITALARLYDNYVQLVVREDGPVRSIHDLKDRRVSIGGKGSGTAVIGERALTIAGLFEDVTLKHLDVASSARALAAKEIDAFFWSGGLPSAAIVDLRRHTVVRLIDLGSIVESLIRRYGDLYTETTVPASVYGLPSAVTTVSVPNYLVVHGRMDPATAYWLTGLLFSGHARLVEAHPEARRLDPGLAIMTHPLDLHEGAVRWYRSNHR